MICIKKTFVKTFIFIILIILSLLFSNNVYAQDLIITPSEISINGEIGSINFVQIYVTNNDVVNPQTVTISYNGENQVYISNPTITIPPNSTRSFNIGFIIEVEEISWITYTYGSYTYNQFVEITIDKVTPVITVFPSNPHPGGNIVFLGDDSLDAHGFIFFSESGNNYPFDIVDGTGFVQLDVNESGCAVARITGEGLSPVHVNFTIDDDVSDDPPDDDPPDDDPPDDDPPDDDPPVSDVYTINSPETILVSTTKEVTIYKNNNPTSNYNVLITKPGGTTYETTTNYFGSISIDFNIVGVWKFTILTDTGLVNKETNCYKTTGNIVVKTEEPLVGSSVDIDVFDDASVTVTGPNGYESQGMEFYGVFSFKPEYPGEYNVLAESDTSKAEISFNVYENPQIVVTNIKGKTIAKSESGKILYVRIVNNENDDVSENAVLEMRKANSPYSLPVDIELRDGAATWVPEDKGNYVLTFAGVGFYNRVSKNFIVDEEPFWLFTTPGLLLLSVILAIVVILIARKTNTLKFMSAYIRQKASKDSDDVKPNKPINDEPT